MLKLKDLRAPSDSDEAIALWRITPGLLSEETIESPHLRSTRRQAAEVCEKPGIPALCIRLRGDAQSTLRV
jgi:hypothetical protein